MTYDNIYAQVKAANVAGESAYSGTLIAGTATIPEFEFSVDESATETETEVEPGDYNVYINYYDFTEWAVMKGKSFENIGTRLGS